MDEILSIYKKYNRPGAQKLLQLSKAEGIQATSKDIKEFLSSRTEEQQLKENRNTKQSHGHIVSYNPFNKLQLDIFVLKKYENSNNGYGYILCIIDIFSRKAFCYPMKSKSLSDTTPAIKKFFSTSGLHEFNSKALVIIMSDSDSAFKGNDRNEDQNFQKILSDNNAVLEPVKLNDHHALGVIDVFAKNLKRVLSKEFLENKKTRWIDILPKIIEQYNNTPHTALDNITPNQAITDPKKREHVMHLNILKAHDNGFVTDLKPGDKVRIDDTSMFKKGTESRWSDEVHVVKEASGKTVTLTDGTTHRRNKILMVPHNTVIVPTAQLEKNVIKVATKQHKDKQLYKRENIKETDVIEGGRSARAGRGVNKYNKHLDQNLKNKPTPEKKTR
jgi:hypothetical protein